MAWVAFDRAIKDAERDGLEGPVAHWRKLRDAIHVQVCKKGFNARTNTFVQYYGSTHLDASLLLIPQVGFLPADDPRVLGTIAAIERGLVVDGLVARYSTATRVDGLPAGRGGSSCRVHSGWRIAMFLTGGREREAENLFEHGCCR